MYPVHDVTGWIAERPEALGSKEKFWLIPPTHVPPPRPHLFKLGRHNTGENWAEKACCEILKSLGIPCAEYNFAIHEGRRGVISERFFQDGGSFVPANMILSRLDPEYDGSLRFKQVRYKLLTAISMLRRLQLQLPQGFGKLYPGMAAHELFIGYLVFDALVGNTDRHHENWGVVVTAENNHTGYYLAPSFDHASSLGRDLTDENRQRRLETHDERFSVEGYAERARSAFYDVGTAGKLLTSREVVAVLTQSFPDSTRLWAEKIAGAELSIFEDILRQVSPNLISDEAVQFSLRLMAYNQRMIREVGLGY